MNQGFNQKDEFQLTNKMIEDLPTIHSKLKKMVITILKMY